MGVVGRCADPWASRASEVWHLCFSAPWREGDLDAWEGGWPLLSCSINALRFCETEARMALPRAALTHPLPVCKTLLGRGGEREIRQGPRAADHGEAGSQEAVPGR